MGFGSSEIRRTSRAIRAHSGASRRLAILGLLWALLSACGAGAISADTELANSLVSRLDGESPALRLDTIQIAIEADELITLCMLEQGFGYEPVDYSYRQELYQRQLDAFEDPAKFVEEFGYGVVDEDRLSQLFASPPSQSPESSKPEYQVALYGATIDDLVAEELQPGGCFASSAGQLRTYSAALEERDELMEQAVLDTDVDALRRAWAACMAAQGYGYWSPSEAVADIKDRFLAFSRASSQANPLSQEPYDELHALEVEIGTADYFRCKGLEFREAQRDAVSRLGQSTGLGAFERLDASRDD